MVFGPLGVGESPGIGIFLFCFYIILRNEYIGKSNHITIKDYHMTKYHRANLKAIKESLLPSGNKKPERNCGP